MSPPGVKRMSPAPGPPTDAGPHSQQGRRCRISLGPGYPTAHPQSDRDASFTSAPGLAAGEQRRVICAVFKVIGDVQVLRLDHERWAGAAHGHVRMRRGACCPDGTQGMSYTARAGRWGQRASTRGAIDQCACFAECIKRQPLNITCRMGREAATRPFGMRLAAFSAHLG